MLHFNFNSTEPIYLQVANQLEEAIFTKAFLDGTQVPSTTEISKEFHINPATVLKGMNILVNDGLLEKRRGLGMFVTEGAYMKLLERRKESFYQDYIVKMIQEAKKLGMNEDDLIELYKQKDSAKKKIIENNEFLNEMKKVSTDSKFLKDMLSKNSAFLSFADKTKDILVLLRSENQQFSFWK